MAQQKRDHTPTQQIEYYPVRRDDIKLKMGIVGPSGSGKTWTALALASGLAGPDGKIAVLESEGDRSKLYAHEFPHSAALLSSYAPANYVAGIEKAVYAGFAVLVIDSISHAWDGKGGVQEIVDTAASRDRSGNKWAGWSEGTPEHQRLIEALKHAQCHIVCTLRQKTQWLTELDARGKVKPIRVGTTPVQREGFEYEFDVLGEMDMDHTLRYLKARYSVLDGMVVEKPGRDHGAELSGYIASATPSHEKPEESSEYVSQDADSGSDASERPIENIQWDRARERARELEEKTRETEETASDDLSPPPPAQRPAPPAARDQSRPSWVPYLREQMQEHALKRGHLAAVTGANLGPGKSNVSDEKIDAWLAEWMGDTDVRTDELDRTAVDALIAAMKEIKSAEGSSGA